MFVTQKQLLEQHRVELDLRHAKRYPRGKFCLQMFNGRISLHWAMKRNTSASFSKGISVEYNQTSKEVSVGLYQKSSFGKCYNYDDLKKLVKSCYRHQVPPFVIEKFEKLFATRQLTLF